MTIKPTKKSGSAKNDESAESQNVHSSQIASSRSQNRVHSHNIQPNIGGPVLVHKDNTERSNWPSGSDKRVPLSSNYDDSSPGPSKRRWRHSPHRTTSRSKLRADHKREQRERTEREQRDGVKTPPQSNLSSTSSTSSSNLGKSESSSQDHSGYNSADEYSPGLEKSLTDEEWRSRDELFEAMITKRDLFLKEMVEDGACLFRAISDQIYGDQDMHSIVRQNTMDYIYKNRDYFAQYVTEDFNNYVSRKRRDHVHGNHLEIQAVSEMYNRTVEVYVYAPEPINIFNSTEHTNGYEPLRLSYQRGSHYNSIRNPWKATVGEGLGLAGYRPGEADIKQVKEAVRQSEDLLIEQTMLEDKMKASEIEATNEAIEEQVARESYLQWCRENEHRKQQQGKSAAGSSATVTSMVLNDTRPASRGRSCVGSVSPQYVGKYGTNKAALRITTIEMDQSTTSPLDLSTQERGSIDFCSYEHLHRMVMVNSATDAMSQCLEPKPNSDANENIRSSKNDCCKKKRNVNKSLISHSKCIEKLEAARISPAPTKASSSDDSNSDDDVNRSRTGPFPHRYRNQHRSRYNPMESLGNNAGRRSRAGSADDGTWEKKIAVKELAALVETKEIPCMSDFHTSLYCTSGSDDDLQRAIRASEVSYYNEMKRSKEELKKIHDPLGPSTSRQA